MSIDGVRITSSHQGLLQVAQLEPGKVIDIEILRGRTVLKTQARVGIRPKLK